MKKINSVVLSTLTAAFLVGCGGGSSSSSSSGSSTATTETPTVATADVTVERGAVYGSTVTDANGQIAVQKSGTNVYTFSTTPVYPISASGGIIDVDNNGIDEGDIELTTTLTSYSTVITPITTYLGDITTNSGKAKLAKLKEIAGVTSDDDFLKIVPSELSTDVLVLTNALFDIMNDGDTSNDDFVSNYTGSAFETKFAELKTEAAKYTDKKEMAKALEEKIITNLNLTTLKTEDLANTTTTSLLKIADLTRFISYYGGDWYDDNTLSDGKITTNSYISGSSTTGGWILEDENDYATITKDATNLYKLSYVDSVTKEEGTFTILSTKKVANYSDLYKTKAEIVVTKMGTELKWYRWDGVNPTNSDNTPITNIDGLYSKFSGTSNATVTKETDRVVFTSQNGTEHSYFKLVEENGNYYIEQADLNDVGYVDNETIYTGTSIDEFITNIKPLATDSTSESTDTISIENKFGNDSLKNQTYYSVWYGTVDDETNANSFLESVPIIEKIIIGNDSGITVTGLLNSDSNGSGYYGIKDNKLYTHETLTFDETQYEKYESGSLSSGCIKSNYFNTEYPINNNTDYMFTDLNQAVWFAGLLTEENNDTIDCPTTSLLEGFTTDKLIYTDVSANTFTALDDSWTNYKGTLSYLISNNGALKDTDTDTIFVDAFKAKGIDSKAEARKSFGTAKSKVVAKLRFKTANEYSVGSMMAVMQDINSSNERIYANIKFFQDKIKYSVSRYDSTGNNLIEEYAGDVITTTNTVFDNGADAKFKSEISVSDTNVITFKVTKVNGTDGATIEAYTPIAISTLDTTYDLGIDRIQFRSELKLEDIETPSNYDDLVASKFRVHSLSTENK